MTRTPMTVATPVVAMAAPVTGAHMVVAMAVMAVTMPVPALGADVGSGRNDPGLRR